jgi:signal transduction histidine kinase
VPRRRSLKHFFATLVGNHTDGGGITLKEFRHSLDLLTVSDQIQNYSVNTISQTFKIPRVALFTLDEDASVYSPVVSTGFPFHAGKGYTFSDKVVAWLNSNRRHVSLYAEPTLLRSFEEGERERWLTLTAEWVFPLLNLNRLTGFIVLGGKRLNKDQVENLKTMSNYLGSTLANARLHKKSLEVEESFHRAEKLAMAGQLAAAAAHEIRNPLTSIRSSIQFVLKGLEPGGQNHDLLANVMEEVDRINKVVEGLLTSVRPQVPSFRRVNLIELIEHLVEPFRLKEELEISLEMDDRCTEVVCDGDQIKQVLLNLLQNAEQVLNSQGKIEISLCLESASSDKVKSVSPLQYRLSVKDNGPGIKESILKKIFEPFFTTKSNEQGTGLGLSICRGIIDKHGGEMLVRSKIGQGSTFEILLPVNKL